MRFWVNGALHAAEHASVSVLDHGLMVGDGVFETMRLVADHTTGVVPFALDRHLDRLTRSAAGMGFPGVDRQEARDAMLAVCAANPELATGGRLRVTLTSGPGPAGSDRGGGPPTLAVTAAMATRWPPTTPLAVSAWPRNNRSPLTGIKSTSYAENVVALARAKALGAGEALLKNLDGDVCEGTGSNVFLVLDRTLATPPLSSGCLAGITRALVIEWSRQAGVPVEERPLRHDDLLAAEEVFITSSTRDVHAVSHVMDDTGERIWIATSGSVTARVERIFAQRAAANWNP